MSKEKIPERFEYSIECSQEELELVINALKSYATRVSVYKLTEILVRIVTRIKAMFPEVDDGGCDDDIPF